MKYTIDEIRESALKYKYRSEFRDNDGCRYRAALKLGIIDDVCSHMKKKRRYKYSDEEVCNAAKKYKTRTEFREKDGNAYSIVIKRKLGDIAFSHMDRIGNKYYRCIYVYEFEEFNTCYIGLTSNLKNRDLQHRSEFSYSAVKDFSKEKKVAIPLPKKLTDYIDKDNACELEEKMIKEYRAKGWTVLNKIPGGGLGGSKDHITYTKELCKSLALNYKSRSEFAYKHSTAYKYTKENGWDDYVFSHMGSVEESRIKWALNMSEYTKKPVIQYDYQHNELNRFESILDAHRKTKKSRAGIKRQVHHKTKYFINGTYFKFQDDDSDWHIKNMKFATKDLGVVQYDCYFNVIKKFKTLKEASLNTGHMACKISGACGHKAKYKGYFWRREFVD